MRTYETIFIVHPQVSGDAYEEFLGKFKDILSQQTATLHKVDEWGSRNLAYPIKKQSRGTYVLFVFDVEPAGLAEFERRARLDESVIKFQSVLLEKFDPSTLVQPEVVSEGAVEKAEEPEPKSEKEGDGGSSVTEASDAGDAEEKED